MNNAQGWDEQQDAGRRRKVWILVCLLLALGLACGIFFLKNTKSADEHWKEDIFSNDGTDMIDHMLLTGEYAKPEENELFRQFWNCREIICIFLESMLIYVMNEFSDSGGHFHGT